MAACALLCMQHAHICLAQRNGPLALRNAAHIHSHAANHHICPSSNSKRFFYADDNNCNTLFCRSGLRGGSGAGFPALQAYRSLRGLLQVGKRGTKYTLSC